MTTKLISELQHEKYQLMTDSQHVIAVLESIGEPNGDDFEGLLVELLNDGDYGEVWGFSGVPYLHKSAIRLQ
jgi:hypothetical protein